MTRWIWILAVTMLCSCASYSGRNLKAGEAGLDDVIREMGQPAMRWQNDDGSVQLAYPRGPAGYHTFMVSIGSDGKLQSIGNALEANNFARIQPRMTREQVLRILGPSEPSWTIYFESRDELVWDWHCLSAVHEPAHCLVLFDATTGTVRSTMTQIEFPRPNFPTPPHFGHFR